ncbi:arsenite efflux transporter metallochaperone ArsD [Serratia fonticola]
MSKIEIFEPAGCCATSSVVVNQDAITFSTDMEWCKKNGLNVIRHNLSKNPQTFLQNEVVKSFLNTSGANSLPLTLLDGKVVMAGRLPSRADFARWTDTPLTSETTATQQPSCCRIPRLP